MWNIVGGGGVWKVVGGVEYCGGCVKDWGGVEGCGKMWKVVGGVEGCGGCDRLLGVWGVV